jgi:superfamily II DNA/RNA helicase
VLIATDCLSEGVNLQEHFDAVVHYDLSWNPTRHEQREGRVDRFGQEQERRARDPDVRREQPCRWSGARRHLAQGSKIREELGVPVPVPDDGHTLTQASC